MKDTTVVPRVAAAVRDHYAAAGVPPARIAYTDTLAASHGYLSARFGNRCGEVPAPPYVETCATATGPYDQPGAILAWIYGALQPKPGAPSSQPRAFNQREFGAPGFASTGYVYVPRQCERGAACAVHVVFHGCRQGAGAVGDAIYRRLAITSGQTATASSCSTRRSSLRCCPSIPKAAGIGGATAAWTSRAGADTSLPPCVR